MVGKWLFYVVTSILFLAFSAFYEMLEWWTAIGAEKAAVDFLGTQGRRLGHPMGYVLGAVRGDGCAAHFSAPSRSGDWQSFSVCIRRLLTRRLGFTADDEAPTIRYSSVIPI